MKSLSSTPSRWHRPARRRVIAISLSTVAMLLVAACSSGGKSAGGGSARTELTPRQALLEVATQTQQVNSAIETLTIEDSGASGSITTATFQVQLKPTLLLAANLTATGAGASGQIKMVLTSTAVYFDDSSTSVQAGKPWLKINLSALSALDTGGASFAQTFNSLQGDDFTNQAELPAVAKNTRVIGTQTVDGVSTTEYTGSLKAADGLKALPASFRQALAPELQALGNSTIYFDEWVDGQHHMRKLSEVETVNGNTINITINVTAINQPVHITVPPASQIYNLQGSGPVSSPVASKPASGLGAKIVPCPPGFSPVTGQGFGGPVNTAEFDQLMGAGLAASYHFVRGYQASCTNSNGDGPLMYLFQFATTADATAFQASYLSVESGKQKADLIIPGADDYDATSPTQGFYPHGVIGTKGKVLFAIDYEAGSTAPVPLVETMARQQYAAL
jgi:hypothetical protein